MSIPINDVDYKRFLDLAELINKHKDNKSEMRIYVSEGYVSIEMRGSNIPQEKIRRVMDGAPNV